MARSLTCLHSASPESPGRPASRGPHQDGSFHSALGIGRIFSLSVHGLAWGFFWQLLVSTESDGHLCSMAFWSAPLVASRSLATSPAACWSCSCIRMQVLCQQSGSPMSSPTLCLTSPCLVSGRGPGSSAEEVANCEGLACAVPRSLAASLMPTPAVLRGPMLHCGMSCQSGREQCSCPSSPVRAGAWG